MDICCDHTIAHREAGVWLPGELLQPRSRAGANKPGDQSVIHWLDQLFFKILI